MRPAGIRRDISAPGGGARFRTVSSRGAPPFASRLRLARRRCGLSMHALGSRIRPPVSLQAISKYETGKMMPSSSVLAGLARVLDVCPDFLLDGPVIALEPAASTRRRPASKQDIAQLEFRMLEGIERRLFVAPAPFPDPFGSATGVPVASQEEIESVAGWLRQSWQVGGGPAPCMCRLLEGHGIPVIEGDLPAQLSGRSYRAVIRDSGQAVRAVFLSAETSLEEKRLTLACELGRQLIRGAASRHHLAGDRAWRRFGAAFLAPADSLRHELGIRRDWVARQELLDLKAHYGIPAEALVRRLHETGILSRRQCERMRRACARSGPEAEHSPVQEIGGFAREGPRFARLVWRALSEDRISAAHAARFLDLSVRDLGREIQLFAERNHRAR